MSGVSAYIPRLNHPRRSMMARVTVEDCVDKVENRFELVLLAAHRARMISSGSPLTIARPLSIVISNSLRTPNFPGK